MPMLGSSNLFLMIGFHQRRFQLDCWIQVLDWGSVDRAKLLDGSCPFMGLALYLILTFSSLWAALSFKNAALEKSYSRFGWGCVPALSYTAPSGVSKENFTQKESHFPEAGTFVALSFLQHSHTGVGSLMAKMDIICHKRTPWLPWCCSTSSDVL